MDKNPDDPLLRKKYADVLYFHGKAGKALQQYNKALSLSPDKNTQDYIHALMGEIFQEREDFEKAMEEFEKADDFYLQGNLQEVLGHLEDAKQLYKKELDVHPDHILAHKELFRLEHKEEDPGLLIQWMFEAPSGVSFSGTQVSTSFLGKHPQTIVAKVSHEAPSVYHIEYTSPKALRGHVFASEGMQFFHYNTYDESWEKEVALDEDDFFTEGEANTSLIQKNFSLRMLPDERVAGRRCLVLQFLPGHKNLPRKTLWLDKVYGIVLKWEKKDAESHPLLLSEFTQVRFLPSHDKLLQETKKINGGKKQHETDAGKIALLFRMKNPVPETLPFGFELQDMKIASGERKQKIAHVDYSDGINEVSLFIQEKTKERAGENAKVVKFKNAEAHLYRKPNAYLLTWTAHDKTFTLVSGLPQDCMITFFKTLSSLQ